MERQKIAGQDFPIGIEGEPDATDWTARLHVYGIDLRHTPSVEALCQHLLTTLPRLDALINNACQTVRRPAGWYDHVVTTEDEPPSALESGRTKGASGGPKFRAATPTTRAPRTITSSFRSVAPR